MLLLSTSDTDLLTARACGTGWRTANPARVRLEDLPPLLAGAGAEVVVVRILGGQRYREDGIAAVRATGLPVVALGGEPAPDAVMMSLSTVPAGVAAQAHVYLAQGGPANLAQLHAFLSDPVLLTGHGFASPVVLPAWGLPERTARDVAGPTVAVLYHRAQHLAGNTAHVEALCTAIEDAGGRALPVYCASLRQADPALLQTLAMADAMVVTVLAALDIPVLQGLCLTSGRAGWAAADDGLSPLDVASQVAVPELDGRLITVPFSFKGIDADGLSTYAPDPERAARVAGIAVRHARLRHVPPGERRIVLMLSAYPTRHARIGNAVGPDTPASAVALLAAMRAAGHDVGPLDDPDALPGLATGDGDALVHALIAAGGQDPEWLSEEQLEGNPVRISAARYRRWFATLPPDLRDAHVADDEARTGDRRRATTRIFGSKPGTYGAGVLQLVDSRSWRDDGDLAEVYTSWGGYAYGRGLDGAPAREDMQAAYRRIAVAAKNVDTREHDIADSDDYYQYHGGMIATVRALTGTAPQGYLGDSTTPSAVRMRSLHEETARVFRARVARAAVARPSGHTALAAGR
ncbi:MAG: cobaltochelatase subunit CobN [Pseudonocardia sp.]